jgi:DNA-directed RNA polymerase II subunit RPB11
LFSKTVRNRTAFFPSDFLAAFTQPSVDLLSVEISEDTKIPNAATFKILKQDHTLANMIRAYVVFSSITFSQSRNLQENSSQLHSSPQVLFAGYKVPHPLRPYFIIKIQTDGTITPADALESACTKLIGLMSTLEAKFKREFSFKDIESGVSGTGVATATADDPYGAGGAWGTGRDYMDF